jgi:hypothetical protein
MNAWADAGAVIEIEWNYDLTTNTSTNPRAARPGETWRRNTSAWLSNTT